MRLTDGKIGSLLSVALMVAGIGWDRDPAFGRDEAEALVLVEARAALAQGDKVGAGLRYLQIKPSSPIFFERLTDTARWHILEQNFQEAWRVTEVARRIGSPVPDLDYLTALAATKHGTCALGMEVADRQKRLLLQAHMYRFYNRYTGGSYSARPYALADSGIQQQHLIASQLQYLADIPESMLLKRKGCRFFYGRFKSRKVAAAYEYTALELFRERHMTLDSTTKYNIDDVEIRLIELAEDNKKVSDQLRLLDRYYNYKAAQWAGIEDQRRQFLWQKLVEHKIYLPPPYRKDSEKFTEVLDIVLRRPPDEGLNWLGLIEWYDIDSAVRLRLVNHLLEAENTEFRPFLLTAKAELLHQKGEMLEALGLVRRLLLLGESDGDPEIERRVAYLAGEIFVEYAYNEKILGAVQNAVPASKWNIVFRMVLLKHALTGNQRGFRLILKVMADAGKQNQMQLDEEQMQLITALADRNFNAYYSVLKKWSEARRPKSNALRIFTDLATSVVPMTDGEFSRIKSFTDAAATFLKKYLMQGEQQVRIQDLLMVYDRARASEWAKGGVSVGASAVAAGSVDLRDDRVLPSPFTWSPPRRLPLADLILVPDGPGSRGWILK